MSSPELPPPARSRRRLVANIVLALASTAITFLLAAAAGEALVRRHARRRHDTTIPLLTYQQFFLGHALVRNVNYFGWVHTDSNGFRGPDVTVARRPGVTRIMIIGSSTTFDVAVSRDDRAWPARLEAWLSQLAPGQRFEVINAGVPGYFVMTDVARLQTDLYRFRPDLVILYEGHNDLLMTLKYAAERGPARRVSNRPNEIPIVTPWRRLLTRHSLLYVKVMGLLQGSGARRIPVLSEPAADSAIEQGADEYQRELRLFIAAARTLCIPVVVPELVYIGRADTTRELDPAARRTWAAAAPYATPEAIRRAYTRYTAALHEVAAQEGIVAIRTGDFGLGGSQWYAPNDPMHFNDGGAERMGQRMAQALLAAGVLQQSAQTADGPGGGCRGLCAKPEGSAAPRAAVRVGSDRVGRNSARRRAD